MSGFSISRSNLITMALTGGESGCTRALVVSRITCTKATPAKTILPGTRTLSWPLGGVHTIKENHDRGLGISPIRQTGVWRGSARSSARNHRSEEGPACSRRGIRFRNMVVNPKTIFVGVERDRKRGTRAGGSTSPVWCRCGWWGDYGDSDGGGKTRWL